MGTLARKINFEKTYFYLISSLAFVLTLSRAAISLFVVSLLLVWIIEGNWKEKLDFLKKSPVLRAISIFIGYMTLTILWSTNTEQALDELRMFGYWLIIPIVAMSIESKDFNKILTIFISGVMASVAISYGILFELIHFENISSANPTPFMNHIELSVFLGLTAVILLHRLFQDIYSKRDKILMFFAFILVVADLFITQGRMGQISFLVILIVVFIQNYKLTLKTIMLSIGFITVLLIVSYKFSPGFENRINQSVNDIKKISNGELTGSIGIRVAYWILAYDIIKENPFGVGIGDMDYDKVSYVDKLPIEYNTNREFLKESYFHNQYLQYLVAGGYLGLLLFLYILFNIYNTFSSNLNNKYITVLFLGIFIVNFMGDVLLMLQFTLVLFSFLFGLLLTLDNNKSICDTQK